MGGLNKKEYVPVSNNVVINWIDERLPIFTMLDKEYGRFPTPKNFSYFWNFGAIAMMILIIMIVSGIFLAMNYVPHTDHAFNSVERIMRDVNYGWLIRYIHANGASMFFVAVYIHIFRGLYYGSYKKPRELLWMLGVVILLLMMATAFMGYVLPWGQMSFWGATVITNLFSAIPIVGDGIVTWLWGGFSVDNPTLNRFYALHFLMPFVIFAVVFLHVWALHVTGSNNPSGIEPKTKIDTVPFHPYYTVKDSFGAVVFLAFFAFFVFYSPNILGHPDNYIPADPLVTPAHIVPEWYFLPFYAILRAVPDIALFGYTIMSAKLAGVLAMFGSIGVLFFIPWLDTSPVRSTVFRPSYKPFMYLLVVSFLLLGVAGAKPADDLLWLVIGRLSASYYFFHFLVIMPLLGSIEKTPKLPDSIHAYYQEKKESKKKLLSLLAIMAVALSFALPASKAKAAGASIDIPKQEWSFNGPLGTFDRPSLQRGFVVYQQVCAACHGLDFIAYRNLTEIGLTELQAKAIAAQYMVQDGPDDEGEMFERVAKLSDRFVNPYPNEKAARYANNGAYPVDLSLITKARPQGSDRLYALLTGYVEAPADVVLGPNMHYNKYYSGHQIAMPAPLAEGMVAYDDGTEATVEQMAKDVTHFLTWTAEPKMEERKRMGFKVMIFLIVFAGILYASKKKIWKDVE